MKKLFLATLLIAGCTALTQAQTTNRQKKVDQAGPRLVNKAATTPAKQKISRSEASVQVKQEAENMPTRLEEARSKEEALRIKKAQEEAEQPKAKKSTKRN